jgi:uroporphyrinogen III methyltransferase/synthase
VFRDAKVAAIGSATAEALERRGLRADLVPTEYIAEELAAALAERIAAGQRILLPRAENARPELVEGLRVAGAHVEEVPLYVAATPREVDAEALARVKRGDVDLVTFASSSTVRNLVQLLGGDIASLRSATVACIGPITADTAREHGFGVDIVAEEHTVVGLVNALKEWSSLGL